VTQTDVVIVGGGLVGLATAMHLQEMQPRLKISLCEKDDHVAAQQASTINPDHSKPDYV